MKRNNQKIITSIFVFFIILLLSISIIMANNVISNKNLKIDEEKIYYEIKYFDSKIINMAMVLANSTIEINWGGLQNQTINIYNYWNSVILDLNYLDINKTDLTDFGTYLDRLTISIEIQDKSSTLNNLCELYNKLIIYIDLIDNQNYKNIMHTKYNLLIAHSIIEKGNWTLAHEYILSASEYIYQVVNSMEINQYLQYNINQVYISVKELENLLNLKDLNIFYFKYKTALYKLDNLTFD